jgi:hypothetical protein
VLVGWEAAQTTLDFDGHPTVLYLRTHEQGVEDVRAVLPTTIDPDNPSNVLVTRRPRRSPRNGRRGTPSPPCSWDWRWWRCSWAGSASATPW